MKSAVYIGAGLDIRPILLFPDIDTFIYIDSQPNTSYGIISYEDKYFYNHEFIDDMIQIMNNHNFLLVSNSNSLIEFKQSNRILKYYINIAFPNHLTDILINDINICDTLILCGFCPNKAIINIMPKLNYIIGSHTCYTNTNIYETEEDKNNSSFQYIINHPYISNNYIFFKENTPCSYWDKDFIIESITDYYEIIKCKNMLDFETYKLIYKE